eukprot:TRINITY_DN18153_c0_g1_i1.p1 TRINITY_DN18153_c0_g1~~TRINITY_DN18153_c0_g1_i1.p1  ORF type:complete len:158 (-),score=27.28 TRINITY_DN18153_c0_g1_i1:16-447(-)
MKALFLVVLLACVFGIFGQPQPSPVPPPSGSDIDCSICKFVVQELDYYIARNATIKDLVVYINTTCNLPFLREYHHVCDKIAEMGLIEFIKLVEANETPAVVCAQQIPVCSSADNHNDPAVKFEHPVPPTIAGSPIDPKSTHA